MVHNDRHCSVHLQTPTDTYRQVLVFPAHKDTCSGIRVLGGETYYLFELADGRCVFLRCVQSEHDAGLQEQLALLLNKHAPKSLATTDDWIAAEKSLTRTDAQNVQLLDVSLDGAFSLPWDTFPGYVQDHFHGWPETPVTDPQFLDRLRSLPPSISSKQDCNAFPRAIHLYYKPLAQWVAQHPGIRQAVEQFHKNLAASPWQALLESGYGMTCSRYNWLVEHTIDHDYPRAQALLRYPLLNEYLWESARKRSHVGPNITVHVLDAIDGNRSLEDALAESFNLPFELLDWFKTAIGHHACHCWQRQADTWLLHLKSIPASCYPQTEADLAVFNQLARCIPPKLSKQYWDYLAPIGWQTLAAELSARGILLSTQTGLPDYLEKVEAYAAHLLPPRQHHWGMRRSQQSFEKLLSCIHPYEWMQALQQWTQQSTALTTEQETHFQNWQNPPLANQTWPEGYVRFCRNTYDLFLAVQHMEIRFYGIHGLRRVIENYAQNCRHHHWQVLTLHTHGAVSSFLVIQLVKLSHGVQFEIVRHLPVHAPLDTHAGVVPAATPLSAADQALAQRLLQTLHDPEHQPALAQLYAETENRPPVAAPAQALAWLTPLIDTLPTVLRDVLAGPPSSAEFAIRVRAALRLLDILRNRRMGL